MTNFEIFREGCEGFLNGLKLPQNPYKRGSKNARAWTAGWHHQRELINAPRR